MGRQSSFTQEIADAICQRMADGESLRQVCRDESMPCIATVMKWARDFPDFTEQYARAREALQEHWAEEILDIADDSTNDWVDREVKGGRHVRSLDEEHVSRARLRIDSRKWLLSKLAAKKYGDKLDLTHQNPDGSNISPPTFGISFIDGAPGNPVDNSGVEVSGDVDISTEDDKPATH